jgi:hypothetical protein
MTNTTAVLYVCTMGSVSDRHFKCSALSTIGAIEKTALDWNPQVYRRRGRPKRTGEGQ